MISPDRLSDLSALRQGVTRPGYNPEDHGVGLLHLGVGAFHRAHQAAYTNAALAAEGGDWRIRGVSLRSPQVAEQLNPQKGLYTLIERGADGVRAQVIGSIHRVLVGGADIKEILALLSDPAVRVVTLTVTEKAYGIDRKTGTVMMSHPAVSADMASPLIPSGVLGILVEGLRLRRDRGAGPLTVLCCDNLPDNGALLRSGVLDFARRLDSGLANWIGDRIPFPSSMVDRITPAVTAQVLHEAREITGYSDLAAVETELFSQWVIEDQFACGRPAWEAGGALFVSDVRPYELMKLRTLNGAHSLLAYCGVLCECDFVRDVMAHPYLSGLVDRHMRAALATLPAVAALKPDDYRLELLERFRNPSIAHRTLQIAMDGTEKLPQRIFSPAMDALQFDQDIGAFAFATAAWMAFVTGAARQSSYNLDDPRAGEMKAAVKGCETPETVSQALHLLPNLFPVSLRDSHLWNQSVTVRLESMLRLGMEEAVRSEYQSCLI